MINFCDKIKLVYDLFFGSIHYAEVNKHLGFVEYNIKVVSKRKKK